MTNDQLRYRRFLRREKLELILTLSALLPTIIALVAYPFLANRWLQLPFVGAFVEQTLIFNSVGPQSNSTWAAIEEGLEFPAHLIAIDSEPVRTTDELNTVLGSYSSGDEIALHYSIDEGPEQIANIVLENFPSRDLFAFFILPYLIGLTYLGIGVWVFLARLNEGAGRAFAVFCASVAVVLGGLFDLNTTHTFSWLWTLAIAGSSASLFSLAILFPNEARPLANYPFLRWLVFAPALILATAALWVLYDFEQPTAYADAWRIEFIYTVGGSLAFIGFTIYRSRRDPSPIARGQARVLLWGSALAFGPITGFLIARVFDLDAVFNVAIYFPAMVAFPIAVAYAILRYRLLNTDQLISSGLSYGILSLIAGLFYALLIYIATLYIGQAILVDNPYVLAIFIVIFALVFSPLRQRIQNVLDEYFFRGAQAYREQLQDFGRRLTTAADQKQIVLALEEEVDRTVRPATRQVFLRDSRTTDYDAFPTNTEQPVVSYFSTDSALPRMLNSKPGAIYLPPDRELPIALIPDRDKLNKLAANLFIPFKGNLGLAGWMAIGPRLSGDPYSNQALGFLEALGDQAALAIERARLYDAEHEQRQLAEALSDTAAVLTSTLDYQEVLARILENVGRVVPHDSANIMLIENGIAKIVRRTNMTELGASKPDNFEGLDISKYSTIRHMIETGQPLVISDTGQDQHWVGLSESSWLGSYAAAPIRSREKVIGFLSLNSGTRGFYTEFYGHALQVFADQASVAIDNAQLFAGLQQSNIEISQAYDATLAVCRRAT